MSAKCSEGPAECPLDVRKVQLSVHFMYGRSSQVSTRCKEGVGECPLDEVKIKRSASPRNVRKVHSSVHLM